MIKVVDLVRDEEMDLHRYARLKEIHDAMGNLASRIAAMQETAGMVFQENRHGNNAPAEAFYDILLGIEVPNFKGVK